MRRSSQIVIKDAESIAKIFSIFSALDDIRWAETTNRTLINYAYDDPEPEEALLTHWLCYVCDRQMPYERIWNVGGYVLSSLVREFLWSKHTVPDLFNNYLINEGDSFCFEGPWREPFRLLQEKDIDRVRNKVIFASRFMPSDAFSIYKTLSILDRVSGRSFIKYIKSPIQGQQNQAMAIIRLASALFAMTYDEIGQPDGSELRRRIRGYDPSKFAEQYRNRPEDIFGRLANPKSRFNKKRLWCAIRDYLKAQEFNPHLVRGLGRTADSLRWRIGSASLIQAYKVVELPGDLWNNNKILREGLFSPYSEFPKIWDTPRTVRAIFELLEGTAGTFYPEQMDVTFSFVPRMRSRRDEGACRFCFFGGGITELCHERSGKICSPALAATGFIHHCQPRECRMKNIQASGICRKADLTR